MTSPVLEIDLETRSELDVGDVGADRYFEHSSTEVIVACWCINDGPVEAWYPDRGCPGTIANHVQAGGTIRGWNVGFERRAWNALLGPRHGWPIPALEQYDDNAALAAAMGLPRALEDAAIVLGLEEQKDAEGHRLMLAMARGLYRDDLDSLGRLTEYCAQDVRTSKAVRRKLKPLSPIERQLWLLDQKVNDRGVEVDGALVEAMAAIVHKEMLKLNADLLEATGGSIEKVSQTVSLARWVTAQGVSCPSLAKDQFDRLLAQPMPDNVRRAIEIRKAGSKSSTTKLQKARSATSADGRARGMLLFNGASTGRWSGKLLQPHNMVRGSGETRPELAIPAILAGHEMVEFCYPNALTAVADSMRGVLRAAPGKTFYSADYSNIEARITAWLARDWAKLEQFRLADRDEGPGMYELQAAGIYGVPVDEIHHDDPRRQTGKTAELALGFGGGVMALVKMGLNYGIDMATAYPALWERTDTDKRKEVTEKFWKTKLTGNGGDLSEKAWLACELTKQYWRKANHKTVESWKLVDDACWHAMQKPGEIVAAGGGVPIACQWDCGFLQLVLPSSRRLYYGDPRVRQVEVPWSDKRLPPKERERKTAVTVMGIDQQTTKFVRYPMYPGLGIQHATQATARDLLGQGMLNADGDFPIVLTVHDELLAEVDGSRPLEEFIHRVCQLPSWAEGLPLVATGWQGPRYHKE